ncbi:MAG: AmpG family muropeptide MFS transporter [Smithellaceae bacterium]|jgi:PAT family beta-lactamase induction signal transducer AmpG|nr:AmpG family muropeptide MFS transporter [Smithellaceae bacterium]
MSDPNQNANDGCASQSKSCRGGEEKATQAYSTEANKGRRMNAKRNPWLWVPSIYIAEGIPYMIVMTVSVVMYKNLGLSNTDIALYTSWLYLPWVIKPLWSPFVDLFRTKRFWIIAMQLAIGGSFACVALTLPAMDFVRYTLAMFWIMAFSSATHDIAADGFYMLGLTTPEQAAFVGVRTVFYRVATIASKGGLVILAGTLQKYGYPVACAWSITFVVVGAFFLALCLYHLLVLPYPESDHSAPLNKGRGVVAEYFRIITLFFRRKDIIVIICFFLFFRFAEAQLVKMVAPFLLDPRAEGGLGLSTAQVGWIYGTVGVVALMLGGLLGGYVIYRNGLKFWLWPMVIIMHVPDVIFVYLSHAQPDNIWLIGSAVAAEQFGYGFGFTAYTMYMIMVSQGEYKTVFYAIGTGIMALGMMLPAMSSGWIQEKLGYIHFYYWILLTTIPGFIVTALVKIDPEYGKKV